MATPTRSQTVSTPKPHMSTPGRLMASPRPGTSSNANRALAYKSPAVKTPASLPGHTHHVSTSSQPSSTPLAANVIHDDILALSSPATALMAGLAPTGFTPLTSGDGLGISTTLTTGAMRVANVPANPEAEKLLRLQAVAETLKNRVAGRGTTREGVDRIAQLEGFETVWDDDDLTVAGRVVEIEVKFDAFERDRVNDVSLKLNFSEVEQILEHGAGILKENLQRSTDLAQTQSWGNLENFKANLRYLSQLDQTESDGACFESTGGLYGAFQKIWRAEKDKMTWRSDRHHVCQGLIGRPEMDRKPRLGLSIDYWSARHGQTQENTLASLEEADERDGLWSARIACEPGDPSTPFSKDWLSDSVLVKEVSPEAILASESEKLRPDWRDPALASNASGPSLKSEADDLSLDKGAGTTPRLLNMHFVCSLQPGLVIPISAVASLNLEVAMLELNQEQTVTFERALQDIFNSRKETFNSSISDERWSRILPLPNQHEPSKMQQHSYALYSAQHGAPLWCMPVNELRFNHPRQLATAIPVLRQYAFVWNLLKSLVEYGPTKEDVPTSTAVGNPTGKTRPLRRGNSGTAASKVDNLLKSKSSSSTDTPLAIDISLDVVSDPSKAKLDLYIPLQGRSTVGKQNQFIHCSIEVSLGGILEITQLHGVSGDESDTARLKSKTAHILTVTEDIGLLVEWLLERTRGV